MPPDTRTAALLREAAADLLRPGSGTRVQARHAAGAMSAAGPADPSAAALTDQAGAILGFIPQLKLVFPDAPLLPTLQAEPAAPRDGGSASADQAERSIMHLVFRARIAAARICLPKDALAAALQALHRERRACLQALRDKIAARRAERMHARLARRFRRAAALTARGVPRRPESEAAEAMQAHGRAAMVRRLD